MQQTAHSLTLMPRQTRLINASEGLLLEVQSGCLWLTRPGETEDHFLVAGARIALHGTLVLIQSDRHPGASRLEAARYRLSPLEGAARAMAPAASRAPQTPASGWACAR
jgi:hypothetical protein